MTFSLLSLIVDTADLENESSFWHHLLGGTIIRTPTHHFLQIDGLPTIAIQQAPHHTPPQWPDGAPQQMHFDLATDDLTAADQRVLDGGGRRLRPTDDTDLDSAIPRVYASPAGHPFCLRTS